MTGTMLATLALAGCGGASGGVPAPETASAPTATPSESPAPPAQVATRAPGNVLPETPTRITLPSGRAVAVAPATTTTSGRLGVPDDPRVAGWWDGGARPGDPFGATVVAAHVDSAERGLGPFAELLDVRRRAPVVVTSPATRTSYRVSSLRLVPKDSLRTDGSVFAGSGDPRLVLITCAGPYDRSRGGYQNLAIVTATPDGPTEEAP